MNKNSERLPYIFSSGFVLALSLMNIFSHYYILGLMLLIVSLVELKVGLKKAGDNK